MNSDEKERENPNSGTGGNGAGVSGVVDPMLAKVRRRRVGSL
jgi:hypothetical protein